MIIKKGNASMTPIESIYEIQSAVLDLQRYLNSNDVVVSKRAQMKYEQWLIGFSEKMLTWWSLNSVKLV
jgi:hypothetical protein